MTKHIVEDGILGKIARKQWELNRRVLEGTLKPDEVLAKLQSIIENAPAAIFDIERPNYVVGEKSYDVSTKVKPDFLAHVAALKIGCVFSKTFLEVYFDSQHFEWCGTQRAKSHKRRLRLAQVKTATKKEVIRIQARQNNHVLADEWDLLAFFEQSGFGEIIQNGVDIHALGGYNQLKEWWDEKGTGSKNTAGVRKAQQLYVRGNVSTSGSSSGYQLNTHEHGDKIDDVLSQGTFFLLRDN